MPLRACNWATKIARAFPTVGSRAASTESVME